MQSALLYRRYFGAIQFFQTNPIGHFLLEHNVPKVPMRQYKEVYR
jgi:hypothetical protein